MRLLARNDPHPELFRDYHDTLARIGTHEHHAGAHGHTHRHELPAHGAIEHG